ncbi:MAG: LPS assembly lipoprotein LptE [Thermodesulfobacteriota bacterium]
MKDNDTNGTREMRVGGSSWPLSMSVLIVIALATALSGCGYHVAGKGGSIPGGITTLSIPFFQNQTQRPDVETVLTTAIADEFINTVSLQVVKSGEGEATLVGTVTSYTLSAISFDSTDVTQEYRLSIAVDLKLVRRSDESILWERKGLADYEDFKVTALSVDATKAAEREALKKMVKDMARLIKEQMVEGF